MSPQSGPGHLSAHAAYYVQAVEGSLLCTAIKDQAGRAFCGICLFKTIRCEKLSVWRVRQFAANVLPLYPFQRTLISLGPLQVSSDSAGYQFWVLSVYAGFGEICS